MNLNPRPSANPRSAQPGRGQGRCLCPRSPSDETAARPIAIDLFCGLGGWSEGLIAEGYDVIGFDIEAHEYGEHKYPGKLVVQDVLTIHGSQFKDAALIVASPPCQEYSYMAMPWKRAKAKAAAIRADETGQKLADLNKLFDACFRIQKEASIAAGRHIPLVVENVRGAIPWVGRSRWNFGSFHLWGDVPALMPHAKHIKVPTMGKGWRPPGHPDHVPGLAFNGHAARATGQKNPGFRFDGSGRSFQSESVDRHVAGRKAAADGLGGYGGGFGWDDTPLRRGNSKSPARKFASAMIAKIPLPLARHIAATYRPSLSNGAE